MAKDTDCICNAKSLFDRPAQEVHEGLENVDIGCSSCRCEQMGHPLPCTIGGCESLLRTIRSACVHYPHLLTFLSLIYAAMRHHREILDLDYALHSADFTQLIELTGINGYDELFGNNGESGSDDFGSTHANSTLGLVILYLKIPLLFYYLFPNF